jgi:hypothetical protein
MAKFTLLDATAEKQCDNCASQEGHHYCLLHGAQFKNMDLFRCSEWSDKMKTENPKIKDQSISKIERHIFGDETGPKEIGVTMMVQTGSGPAVEIALSARELRALADYAVS